VLGCDSFLVVTATFQRLYVFVIVDITTRRVLHRNVTDDPTVDRPIQPFRNGLALAAIGSSSTIAMGPSRRPWTRPSARCRWKC
jgi:hypothetical protein